MQHSSPKDKFELRRYLEQFNLRDEENLREHARTIFENVIRVMEPYERGERGEDLRAYYATAVNYVRKAYENKDFERQFPESLDFMIGSLEWE